ncbi:MAG: carbohydrate kinase family protein [Candidatus Lokiarchaeota archaeon]|nr:carbohydrate kinase family protein [Candidatus Lokiarchaeota archaeon]
METQHKPLDLVAIGAANMDIIAKVDKFPEIDDQVAVNTLTYAPGGSSANTVVSAAKLGLKVGFLGKVGRDHNGIELIKAFQDVGVDTDGIIVDADLPSGQVFIPVDQHADRMIFAFPGAPQALKREDIVVKASFLEKALVVHLGSLRVTEPLVEAARRASDIGAIVSMNPGGINATRGYKALKGILDHVDVLVVSRRELDKMFGHADIDRNAETCFQNTGVKLMVVTLGPRGSKYYYLGASGEIEPIFDVPAVNTTGAGDAFFAGFMAKLLRRFKECLPDIKTGEMSYKSAFHAFLKQEDKALGFFQGSLTFGNATAAFIVQGESARVNMPSWDMVVRFIADHNR